ncbi:MAG: hypothetical protein JKY22_12260 [Flavobacteriaceae bacterium]|nr:hypothetical protein [Flavobacteriaceae bacterium]
MNKSVQIIHKDSEVSDKERVINYISSLTLEDDKPIQVSFGEYKTSKTLNQLGYYWGVVVKIAGFDIGLESKEMDAVLKEELVAPKYAEAFGKITEVRKSIAEMKVKEMSDYIDACVRFLGERGIEIPMPYYLHES